MMSITWLQPAAWWGLLAVAVPVLLHLLIRQRHRRVVFPSLRFLPAARFAAMRRWRLADWPLLAVRILILALASAAWAAPVLVSDFRRAGWNDRVARGIVLTPGSSTAGAGDRTTESAAIDTAPAAFQAVFSGGIEVRDDIARAVEWLERQPPARRELLIAGDLREGVVTRGDLARVPTHVGITLRQVNGAGPGGTVTLRGSELAADGTPQIREIAVEPGLDVTRAEYRAAEPASTLPLRVEAAAEDQARADAVLRAVLAEGLRFPRAGGRALVVQFDGALPAATPESPASAEWMRRVLVRHGLAGGERDGELMVRAGMRPSDPRALRLLAEVARSAFEEDLSVVEPRRTEAATLASWSRDAGDAPQDAPLADEGDRRYLWAAVLLLLAVEQWLRGRARSVTPKPEDALAEERVA